MKLLPLAAVAAAVLWIAPPSAAETLEESRDWYRPEDYARASEFFLPLARQGNAAAQESLGLMYASGQGVPRDHVQAYLWTYRALKQAEGEAAVRRAATLAALEAKMTPAEIAEARSLARSCAPRNLRV
ncbi:MAG: sel1 repeat family protein [Rhodospirillales bacterium]|nr:sel1 repeat family protein [Rhodospirillales bacterium]